jgi:hypothetical protein
MPFSFGYKAVHNMRSIPLFFGHKHLNLNAILFLENEVKSNCEWLCVQQENGVEGMMGVA